MSKIKHTPAPWMLELPTPAEEDGGPDYDDPACREDLCIRMASALRDEDGNTPGSYFSAHLITLGEDMLPGQDPEMVANAYLIAAAPDLLAALKAALGFEGNLNGDERIAIGMAAISKAEGSALQASGREKP